MFWATGLSRYRDLESKPELLEREFRIPSEELRGPLLEFNSTYLYGYVVNNMVLKLWLLLSLSSLQQPSFRVGRFGAVLGVGLQGHHAR